MRARALWAGALVVAVGLATIVLWPRARHEPAARRGVTVVIVDRWEAGLVKPDENGDYPAAATTKLVASLHRDPNDSLVVVTYSRAGGYTQMLLCSESTVGAAAGWPPQDRPAASWKDETCVTRGLERAARYLATQKGDRRVVIVSDDPRALAADVEALISRIAASGIAISRVGPDDIEALRRVIR
jgi:hypothetical protein